MKTIIWLLYLSLVVYCLLDGLHTMLLLEHGIEEANPIMVFLIDYIGTWAMFAFKMTWLGLLGLLLARYTHRLTR